MYEVNEKYILSCMLHSFVFGFVKKLCTVVFNCKPRCNHCLEKLVKLHIGVPLCCTALLRLNGREKYCLNNLLWVKGLMLLPTTI
jgi:hypothetical protein